MDSVSMPGAKATSSADGAEEMKGDDQTSAFGNGVEDGKRSTDDVDMLDADADGNGNTADVIAAKAARKREKKRLKLLQKQQQQQQQQQQQKTHEPNHNRNAKNEVNNDKEQEEEQEEPFDYANAPSVMYPASNKDKDRNKNKSKNKDGIPDGSSSNAGADHVGGNQGKPIPNFYARAADAKTGLKRQGQGRVGRSGTFAG